MADNFEANAGSGGDTFGADDIGGVKYTRSKLIHGADGTNDGDVSKANPLPVGFNTAKDGSGTLYAPLVDTDGHTQVDVLSCASHAVTNAGTFAVQAAQSGTWNITTVSAVTAISNALPAGTNAIGKLVANSGVDIGDVDVTSVIPGTGATNLGKAIDSAAGSTDTGVAILAIRDDSLSSLTPAEGDWTPLRVSSTGALHVTGGGGGTQYAVDDAAGGTDTGTLLLAIRDDSLSTLTPVDGDYVGLRVNSTGALHVTGGGGGTEYSEDAATPSTIVGTATMMERDDALGGLTPAEGDWAAMRCSANGALWVTVDGTVTVGSHAVTNAGTFAVQAAQSGTWNVATVTTVTTCSTLTTITNAVKTVGNTAHDAALSDAPVCIGGYASATAPTNVGAGDAVRSWHALNGALYVALVDANGQQVAALSNGALQVGGNWTLTDDSAFSPATDDVVPVAFFADEASTDSVNEGDIGAARMTLDRKQIVTVQPHTTGGLTMHKTVSAASDNATSVKNSAGKLYEIVVSSVNAAVRYLKLYDKASAPTVGTDTPVWTIPIPGNTAGAGIAKTIPMGLEFTLGIAFALTTEATDAGTTGVSANEHVVNLGYK